MYYFILIFSSFLIAIFIDTFSHYCNDQSQITKILKKLNISQKDIQLINAHLYNDINVDISHIDIISYSIYEQNNESRIKTLHLKINCEDWYYYQIMDNNSFATIRKHEPIIEV
jgi:hypothetical protein